MIDAPPPVSSEKALSCLMHSWQPGNGALGYLEMTPPNLSLERLWVHMQLRMLVSVDDWRLILSIWSGITDSSEADVRREVEKHFLLDTERPRWRWKRGKDLMPGMMQKGNPWAHELYDGSDGQATVYAWHLEDPS